MNENQCRATYDDLGYQCEAEAGHDGPHYFTSYVECEGCWSCRDGVDYPHAMDCEAAREMLAAWENWADISWLGVDRRYPWEAAS